MKIQKALGRLLEHRDLAAEEMSEVMHQVMTGETTPAQIGAFLAALRMKGETVDEVAAAAGVMRSLADRVTLGHDDAVDIVGTGGDTTSTFNVSTCSALVAAAAGIKVAKHGNRSVSSKSGAADLLEAAGVNINLAPAQVAHCIDTVGVGFMFAPRHHNAMKHAVGPRREMGVRTIFNLLGPLTNPAGVHNQVLGVFAREWVRPIADVLQKLGSRHVIVVHGQIDSGEGGMDEISVSGATQVAQLRNGSVTEYQLEPAQFGMDTHPLNTIQVEGAEQSLAVINDVLDNKSGAARDIVLLNSGAAIHVGGKADSIQAGVDVAKSVLANGTAKDTLARLVAISQEFPNE